MDPILVHEGYNYIPEHCNKKVNNVSLFPGDHINFTLYIYHIMYWPFASTSLCDVRMTFSVNNVHFGRQNMDY